MVEHVLIPDADRHEPKHASTALDRQALVSNGDGTTEFSFIDYGDLANVPAPAGYRQILYGASNASSQAPAAVNTPLQIEFGALQNLPDVSLSSTGTLTFNTSGDYLLVLFMRFGRTTAAGTAIMFNRLLYNDVQALSSNSLKLPDQDMVIPFSAAIPLEALAGATFKVQIMRDSAGINNGGLFQLSPSLAGWNTSPSASLLVYKYVGDE
jgi:hypothetical protein